MRTILVRLLYDESAATAIEYGLIAALVSVAGMAGLTALGTSLEGIYTSISAQIDAILAAAPPPPDLTQCQEVDSNCTVK